MPNLLNFKKHLIFLTFISWALLLGNTLFYHYTGETSEDPAHTSVILTYILKGVFMIAAFLVQRIQVNQYRGGDFISPLRKLFSRGGVTAFICLGLYYAFNLFRDYHADTYQYLQETLYAISFGLFVLFIARGFYVWRRMIMFQKTKALEFEFRWFEILLFSTILIAPFQPEYTNFVFIPLVALLAFFMLFLSLHLKWIAYLTVTNKWKTILLLLANSICLLVFIWYFNAMGVETDIALNYLLDPFILLATLFVSLYSTISFLVAFFSLPTSSVFEQRRQDQLNFQRLSQLIQQGEDENQVYKTFFESAVKAADADAAWLELIHENDAEVIEMKVINPEDIEHLRHLAQGFIMINLDYIHNNLDQHPEFKKGDLLYKSIYLIPLKSPQRTFGILYLLKELEQGFDRETTNVIRTFANQTVLTIENLRLAKEAIQNERYKEELKIASTVQESLIPKTFPSDSWFEISCFSQAAKEVGGDFYDFLQLSEGRIAIIIGDVSGKGISAAFHMAQMKGIFHGLMQDDLEPVKFMVKANKALTHCLEKTSFITSSLYIIDYKLKGFFFARAGHCHTLYYNSMTEETFYFNTEGLGLGIIRDASYGRRIHNMHYDYNPGDVMVIYTDGIVEARNKQQEEYGEERLREMLAQTHPLEANDIKYAIIHDLNVFSMDTPIHDDQTLLVIKFRNVQPNF